MRTSDELRPIPVRPQRRGTQRIVRTIGILGRVFVGAGLILLFYTSYLLWGTGVYTKQEQKRAADELARKPLVSEQSLSEGNIPPARPAGGARLGDPLFTLKIPKIGLETVVVQGIGREELKKGPGHFPDCNEAGGSSGECVQDAKYPGEKGNVAVSGHRTTYGAPFFRLNELEPGDVIDFISGRARYRYKVREQKIVDPVSGFGTVEQHGRDEVTLTTCHPRFSAAQRLIVHGDYVGASITSSPTATGGPRGEIQAERQRVIPTDVLVLGSIAAAAALGALALSKRFRMIAIYISLAIVGAAGLWVGVFPRVLALMPANY